MTYPTTGDIHTIGIIGAGEIGLHVANLLALQGFQIKLYNRYHGEPDQPSPHWLHKMGLVMDMNDALQLPHFGSITLTHELDDLRGSYAIVITAGGKRSSPDETREQLAAKNAKIIAHYTEFLASTPESLTMIISNPVDALTQHLIHGVAKLRNISENEVGKKMVGVSLIDTMRLQNIVAAYMAEHHPDIDVIEVKGIALGEHGPSMVPLMSSVHVNDTSFSEFASVNDMEDIASHVVLRGNDIIKLTGASSVLGPAHAVAYMITSISRNPVISLPCSVWDGQRAIGMLTRFKKHEVNALLPVPMTEDEKARFEKSQKTLDSQYQAIVKHLQ